MNRLLDRLIGTFVGLVLVVMLLPALAQAVQAGVPVLVTAAIFLGAVRLVWPCRGRRR